MLNAVLTILGVWIGVFGILVSWGLRLRYNEKQAKKRKTIDAHAGLTSKETADFLGVSSINTLKNWLEGGHFPGAFQTPGGHWRFPRTEVEAVKARMEEIAERNREGDLTPPDAGNSVESDLNSALEAVYGVKDD